MKPKIEDHDIDFKTRTIQKLLRQGDKVKITVMFRGREITHPQLGKSLLEKVFDNLEGHGTLEKDASLEGRRMSIVVAPDKRGIAAYQRAQEAKAAAKNAEVTAEVAENVSSEEATNQHDDAADEVNVASDNVVEDDSSGEVVDSQVGESAEEPGDSE